jgi:hypothetical protein
MLARMVLAVTVPDVGRRADVPAVDVLADQGVTGDGRADADGHTFPAMPLFGARPDG